MSGTPRRVTQQVRAERRASASPYSRPADKPATQPTPGRFSSLMSYLSPFRSASKTTVVQDEQDNQEEDDDEGEGVNDTFEMADHKGDYQLGERAPPSPTPAPPFNPSATNRLLYPSLSTSHSMPVLPSPAPPTPKPAPFASRPAPAATPSRWGTPRKSSADQAPVPSAAASGSANEALAEFFRQKADAGDKPLTAIEQAGVFQLMQQAQAEQSLPTAFTPNFRAATPGLPPRSATTFDLASLARSDSAAPASPSGSTFSVGTSTGGDLGTPRRRRPIYVGAGYSARKRKSVLPGTGGLVRSQSAVQLPSAASVAPVSPVAEGKRRRVENGGGEQAEPVAVVAAAPASPARRSLAPAPKFAQATPVRPSPLWQVSKADTPSPSPPKRSTAPAPPALVAPTPVRAPTAAADLIMGVIRSEELAHPSPRKGKAERAAVLNPYESERTAVIPRIPRSRPRRSEVVTRRGVRGAEEDKKVEKEVSPLEQLERSMPAEYRREEGKRLKPSPASPAPAPPVVNAFRPAAPVAPEPIRTAPAFAFRPTPAPAPVPAPAVKKAASAAVEVVELSDSDEDGEGEDEEDEEMDEEDVDVEEEEEDEDEIDEEDDEMDDGAELDIEEADDSEGDSAPVAPVPIKPLFSFGSNVTTAGSSPAPSLSSFSAPAHSRSPSLSAPSVPQPDSPKASLPPPVPAVAAPSAPVFSFSAAATAPLDVKEQVRRMDKAKLLKFAFAAPDKAEEETDSKRKVAREMAKEASGTEVPKFVFAL